MKFGRYEIQAEIGQGAMGKVYRAHDPLVQRLVAIKAIKDEILAQDKAGDYRSSLKKYSIPSLLLGMAVSAALFFLAYTLFALQFKLQLFLLLIPPLAVFFLLIFRKTLKEKEIQLLRPKRRG